METWDAIRARRNVRDYEDRAIPPEHLERILEAAWRTPSSMNEQPWDFVVCTDREALRQLGETWRYARHVGGSVATIVLVAPQPTDQDSRDWIFYDMGQATMQMMLAAAEDWADHYSQLAIYLRLNGLLPPTAKHKQE